MERRTDRTHADAVLRRVDDLERDRPGIVALPKDILVTALARYRDGRLETHEIRPALQDTLNHLQRTMVDFEIARSEVRSIGRKGSAGGLMIYSAKPVRVEGTVLVGAYSHTFLFRPAGLWFVASSEPAIATTHLHARILGRSGEPSSTFTATQKRLSAFWPLIVEVGQRLRSTRGTAGAIRYFVHPWADGLILGEMQKLEGAAALATPTILRFHSNVGREQPLQDMYSRSDQRLLVNVKTFVGPEEMKPGQQVLADRMNAVLARYQDVVEHLRLKWQIALGVDVEISLEIMRVMRLRHPDDERVEEAVQEMIGIVDSAEWRREAEFNERSQLRYRADAARREASRFPPGEEPPRPNDGSR